MKIDGRVLVFATAVAGLSLSGCVSSPTYGTDKSAGAQLFDDVSSITSFGQGNKKPRIDYKPRPDLVRPAAGQGASLPAPQDSVAQVGDPAWPESPEQRRQRLRDEITANRDNVGYVSPVVSTVPVATGESVHPVGSRERVEDLKRQRKEQTVGTADTRRYLSEPPTAYRQAASTAPVGELGEDEIKKERQRKAAARNSKSWRDILPWN